MRLSSVMRIFIIAVLFSGIILSSASCTQALNYLKKLRVAKTTSGRLEIPINTVNASNVGSLEFEVVYDPTVLKAEGVEKGKLADDAMIDFSTTRSGRVWVAIVDSNGLNGNGSLAVVSFSNVGQATTGTTFTLQNVYAYNAVTLIDFVTSTTPGTLTTPPSISFTR